MTSVAVFGIALFLAASGMLASEPAPTEIRLTLDMSDGSRITGAPVISTITIQSELGKIDVPFTKVKNLTFRDDHEGVSVALLNGDLLSGTDNLGKFRLKTLFGELTIEAAFIRRITCEQAPSPKPDSK